MIQNHDDDMAWEATIFRLLGSTTELVKNSNYSEALEFAQALKPNDGTGGKVWFADVPNHNGSNGSGFS